MSVKRLLFILIAWQVLLTSVLWGLGKILPLQKTFLGDGLKVYLTNPLIYSRANFDGNHYLNIARSGYGHTQEAFFPLYSNLIRFFARFTPHVNAGIIISSISFAAAMIFFTKLIYLDYKDKKIVFWTVIGLLVFPTSFFFGMVYTESLFLMLTVMSFYFARTGRWWLVGICGALASYTRLIGIVLLPALLIERWAEISSQKSWANKLKKSLPILMIALGLLTYMYYLWKTTGDAFAFIYVQKLFGQDRSDKLILLYQVFWRYYKMLISVDPRNLIYFNIVLESITGLGLLVYSIYAFFRQRKSYAIFAIILYLVPTLTGNFISLPRYVLTIFPFFIDLGRLLASHQHWRWTILVVSSFLFLGLWLMFARGYWIA